ncbi:MAG: hypothetical protein GC159_14130 [Phycisphaera sp.]|nr:hypothetical protein [Phycisphaera sp.]
MSEGGKFTIREAGAIAAVLVVLSCIGVVVLVTQRERANRTICSINLAGIYKAMYTYSTTCKDYFPHLYSEGATAEVFGFHDNPARDTPTLPPAYERTDNVTAALWIIVRDGSTGPRSWVCPSRADALADPLTTLDAAGGYTSTPAVLENTYDFGNAHALSYSPLNLYNPMNHDNWSADVSPAWVIMADDNDASDVGPVDRAGPHTRAGKPKRPYDPKDLAVSENSSNHRGEGQNLLFGDSHVAFTDDPFQGPSDDNVYAVTRAGANAPPSLRNDDGDLANVKTDVTLLPITGNGGGAGSLDPKD